VIETKGGVAVGQGTFGGDGLNFQDEEKASHDAAK
jgi:hypothetical protein